MKKITPIVLAIVTILTIVTIAFTVTSCGNSATATPKIGDKAPDFKLQSVSGEKVSSSDFRGKPLMIIFQKTMNCPGCKAQMPFVLASYEQRANKDLTIITIYRGDDVDKIKGFIANLGWTLPALADPEDQVARSYGFPPGAPISVFVDANGIIKTEKIGPFQSQDEVKAIFDSL